MPVYKGGKMLYIKTDGQDYEFYKELENRYTDIIVADSKNFDGSMEIVEVFITLTPVILSALTVILHDILSYYKSKNKYDSKNQTEIKIEKKTKNGEFKVVVKSSSIDDVDQTVEKTIQQIKKL